LDDVPGRTVRLGRFRFLRNVEGGELQPQPEKVLADSGAPQGSEEELKQQREALAGLGYL
jgi:hypothetical protein